MPRDTSSAAALHGFRGFRGDGTMKQWRPALLVLCVCSFLSLPGCGDDDPVDPGTGAVVVAGTVVEVRDETPFDGGVVITITTAQAATERLLFPSLHTSPPPSQQTIDLVDRARRVVVGAVLRATGTRTADGVKVESFEILK
jgi:hypothetical protein